MVAVPSPRVDRKERYWGIMIAITHSSSFYKSTLIWDWGTFSMGEKIKRKERGKENQVKGRGIHVARGGEVRWQGERKSGGKGRGEDYVATHLSLLLFKCVTPSFFTSFDGFHPKLRKGKI